MGHSAEFVRPGHEGRAHVCVTLERTFYREEGCVHAQVILSLKVIICFYPKPSFKKVPYNSDEEWGGCRQERAPLEPRSDITLHQILSTGRQSAREFGLTYKFGASKLTLFSKMFLFY